MISWENENYDEIGIFNFVNLYLFCKYHTLFSWNVFLQTLEVLVFKVIRNKQVIHKQQTNKQQTNSKEYFRTLRLLKRIGNITYCKLNFKLWLIQ